MKFCPNCGAKIVLENAKFCHECGFNLFGAKQRVEVPTYSEDEKVENNELKYYKGSASKYSVSNGIVTIKYHAIESDSIKTLVIPSSVTKIESGGINIVKSNSVLDPSKAYGGCINLECIEVSSDNKVYKSINGDLYNKEGTSLIQYAVGKKSEVFNVPEGVVKIGLGALFGANNLKKIVLPKSFGDDEFILGLPKEQYVEIEIHKDNPNYKVVNGHVYSKDGKLFVMYNGRKGEKTFVVPNGVTVVDNCAFCDKEELERIVLPHGLVSIGEMAFDSCVNLSDINLPSSVTCLGTSCFACCECLEHITLPHGIKEIPPHAFESSGLVHLIVPGSVKVIGEYAFSGCNSLTHVVISSSVETIECEGFSFCDNLKEFLFFEGITTIKESALYGCNSLESIRLPKSLKTIECEAFEDCESLKTIYVVKGSKYSNLPEGVKVKEY